MSYRTTFPRHPTILIPNKSEEEEQHPMMEKQKEVGDVHHTFFNYLIIERAPKHQKQTFAYNITIDGAYVKQPTILTT